MSDSDEKYDVQQYDYYKKRGALLASEGEINGAIRATEKALSIKSTDRLLRRLEKMKAYQKAQEISDEEKQDSEEENEQLVEICEGFRLFHRLAGQLYPYQREGIAWMWRLHVADKGGVLGDDMGLGKTLQVIAFLSGLFDAKYIRTAMIIMPVSLITNWNNEFQKWAPGLDISTYHSQSKAQREKALIKVQRHGGILISSYGMMVSNVDNFKSYKGINFVWDYIVLDEGHKIKNPTKTTKAAHEISAKHRLVLSGTPIQNNLRELWALYDFAHQGTLLGSLPTFKNQYENPITRAREKGASGRDKVLGDEMSASLRALIGPYFLRRTKDEVMRTKTDDKENCKPGASDSKKCLERLPQKNDLILWLHLSDRQIQIYDDFVNTDEVKQLLNTKKSPLVALTVLKKICDHPRLLSKRACLQLGMNGEISKEELERMLEDEETSAPSIDVEDEILLAESGKLSVLVMLLEQLRFEGHRTLVFSQSRKMLDILNNILVNRSWNVLRLDGTIHKLDDRQKIINTFQTRGDRYPVMLLTTQVGGVGLTLTGADRVVIYDPSWNPATDSQAVDRAYRIGQQKPVVVYRLITCGTVEEKIYRRQIFKDSITKKAMGAHEDPHRYFSNTELRELFILGDPRFSSTQRQLQDMHSEQRQTYPELDEHLARLHELDIFGISDHDLMFKGNFEDPEDQPLNTSIEKNLIRTQVDRAKLLLQLESEEAQNHIVRTGAFSKDLTSFRQAPKQAAETATRRRKDESYVPESPDSPSEDEIDSHDDSDVEELDLKPDELVDLKNLSLLDGDFAKALEISMNISKKSASRKSWHQKGSIADYFPPVKDESLLLDGNGAILVEDSDEEASSIDVKPASVWNLNQTLAANMPSMSKPFARSGRKSLLASTPMGNISVLNETDEEDNESTPSFYSIENASHSTNGSPRIKKETAVKIEKEPVISDAIISISSDASGSEGDYFKNPKSEKVDFCSDTSLDDAVECAESDLIKSELTHPTTPKLDNSIIRPFRSIHQNKNRIVDSSYEDSEPSPASKSEESSSPWLDCSSRKKRNSTTPAAATSGKTTGKRERLLDSDEEINSEVSSNSTDSASKKARHTPEGDDANDSVLNDTSSISHGSSRLELSTSDEDRSKSHILSKASETGANYSSASSYSHDSDSHNDHSFLEDSSISGQKTMHDESLFEEISSDESLPELLNSLDVQNGKSPDMF